jgi:hypothetical protein
VNSARSGGRTAAQRTTRSTRTTAKTEGTAALRVDDLRVEAAEPLGVEPTRTAPRLKVAPPAPISAPRAPFIAVVIALVLAGVFGILLVNTKTNENAFRIAKLQEKQTALDNQQQKLENQIADYKSPGSLDAAAHRLGLVKADAPAYIRLPDGRIIGVPKPGQGAKAVTAQDPSLPPTGAAAPDGDAANGVTGPGATGTVQQGAVQDQGQGATDQGAGK